MASEEKYYRKLADQAHENARRVSDPDAKRIMFQIALTYENLADRALEQDAATDKPKSA